MLLKGFFEDALLVSTYRGDYLASGVAGLAIQEAAVKFDNVTVTQLEPATMETFRTRPLVIAHRGFSGIAPENTIAAYEEAIKIGAEMGECDTSLSADGILVIMHDSTVDRTTDGEGKVNDLSLKQLKALDAGSWKSPKYKGERIPTLEETLRHLKGRMRLCIEIKQEGIEQQVVDTIHRSGVEPQDTMIFSFHYDAVKNIARIEPLLPTSWLLSRRWKMDTDEQRRAIIKQALAARVSVIASDLIRVNPFLIRLAHECGFQFFVWTVDDPMDVQYLIDIGVDGMITNYPDRLLSLVKKTSGRTRDPSE